jgi:phage repressor protein C with HTH and peptisase S24 domain
MTQTQLARAMGMTQPSIKALEVGEAKRTNNLHKFASVLGQAIEWLELGDGAMRAPLAKQGAHVVREKPIAPWRTAGDSRHYLLPSPDEFVKLGPDSDCEILGTAQAGVWTPTFDNGADRERVMRPMIPGYEHLTIYGFRVKGPSMDDLFPHGSLVYVVRYDELGRDPVNGDIVVAARMRSGEYETTVKEFRTTPDMVARLWPRSSHPDHQAPVALTGDEADEILIPYLVVGSLQVQRYKVDLGNRRLQAG